MVYWEVVGMVSRPVIMVETSVLEVFKLRMNR